MIFTVAIAAVVGFFLPGYLLARILRRSDRIGAAFVFSVVILFHAIFWMGVSGFELRFGRVLLALLVISAVMFPLARKEWFVAVPRVRLSGIEKLLVGIIALLGVIFTMRVLLAPECGFDSIFRWDFLAERMLQLRNFRFYPPMSAADFRVYPYPDGIPPLVPFANWWLYAAAGQYAPMTTALFVAPQWFGAIYFTVRIGRRLHLRGAGFFAAAVLATCPLFNASVAIGQETGMTALGTAAMLCFVISSTDTRGAIAAGIAAAAICLSREYGPALALCGLITAVMLRRNLRWMVVYAIVVLAVASPWYFRNWQITGNPLYDNAFLGLYTNPLHAAIMHEYWRAMGPRTWGAAFAETILDEVSRGAPVVCLFGLAGAVYLRRHAWLAITALVAGAIWAWSIGYTGGGWVYSMRTLTPVWVILSILAGLSLDAFAERHTPVRSFTIGAIMLLTTAMSALCLWVYPDDVRTSPTSEWATAGFERYSSKTLNPIIDRLRTYLNPPARLIASNAALAASAEEAGFDVLSPYSPELDFLFDRSLSPEQIHARLVQLGVEAVIYETADTPETQYLRQFPFFSLHLPGIAPVDRLDQGFVLFRIMGKE
jgi:hypothetical protein